MSQSKQFIAKRKDVNPKSGKEKYGNVKYADEKNKKYPIDTEAHIRAAWNYINKSKNAGKYSPADAKTIKGHIVSAWKEKIDKAGPPSAKEECDTKSMDKEDPNTGSDSEMADIQAKDFVIFRAGHWNDEDFTETDLDNMVSSFSKDEPIPIIVGHSSDYKGHTRIPAFGRIMGGLKRVGKDLIAMGVEFNDKLANWIREGFYNQRSIELTRDNKRVLAVGMLGAVPPAVKGLPANDEALDNIAMQFSEDAAPKIIEFADATAIDLEAIESLFADNAVENIAQEFAMCLAAIEACLSADTDTAESKETCLNALSDCYQEIAGEINSYFTVTDKLDELEPPEPQGDEQPALTPPGIAENLGNLPTASTGAGMADRLRGWFGIKPHKEIDMDAQKEKEFLNQIAELKKKVKEFQDAEAATEAAKAKELADAAAAAEAEAKAKSDAEAAAALEADKKDVTEMCDKLIKEGRMTPAMREIDEPIILALPKESRKSFAQKYEKVIVPLGEVAGANTDPAVKKPIDILSKAAEYAAAHASDKEFAGLSPEMAQARAMFLQASGRIKFE